MQQGCTVCPGNICSYNNQGRIQGKGRGIENWNAPLPHLFSKYAPDYKVLRVFHDFLKCNMK